MISSDATTEIAVGNGFTCAVIDLVHPRISRLCADFAGAGNFGANVLAETGIVLEREDLDGVVHSSADAGPVPFAVISNTSEHAELVIKGLRDSAESPAAHSDWTISLAARARSITFKTSGRLTLVNARAVRLTMGFRPASIYSFFDRGVVQMRGQNPGAEFYASKDALSRLYALGGLGQGNQSNQSNASNAPAKNMSISFRQSSPSSDLVGHVIVSRSSEDPAGFSGVQMVLAGSLPELDTWSGGWKDMNSTALSQEKTWTTSVDLAPNNFDFPAQGPFGDLTTDGNIPQATLQAFLTGIYASPVGQLCTHDNGVERGERVGLMATTIARPDYGYSGSYNFFDPDNYLSTAAMLFSGDPYLQDQVRIVLEHNGNFMNERGQLPHHFQGTRPTFQALSGETQTGPNVFWILSCFNYAKATGNLKWLQEYMPKLRTASAFLFYMIDPERHLLKAPGSLMIDVFIRRNFATDTNAMAVGFLHEFANAEAATGNSTGATRLHEIANTIARAVEEKLWSNESNDHYVTQLNPDGSSRDFVDYDANLIALAHGIASKDRASAVFKRVDAGRCTHGRATFVAEKHYGYSNTTGGNMGDSWCSMGRIGWFDALARQRFGDQETFDSLLLEPLIGDVNRFTWLRERYSCDGEQQSNRTSEYFEYPSVTAMMIHYIRYGIQLGFQEVTIKPFGMSNFHYNVGNVHVEYSQERVALTLPGIGMKAITVHGLLGDGTYHFQALAEAEKELHKGPGNQFCANGIISESQSSGKDECKSRCAANPSCQYFSLWTTVCVNWCRLSSACTTLAQSDHTVNIFHKAACDTSGRVVATPDGVARFNAPVGQNGRACTITLTSASSILRSLKRHVL